MSDASLPIGTDPLGAIRVELVGAARRRTAARRRRQRLVTIAATAVMGLASVGGAAAVIPGSTGVSAVDDFLGKVDSNRSNAPASGGANGNVPAVSPATPGSASKPLELRIPGSSRRTTLVAYLSGGGSICLAISKPHGEGASEAREGWGCMAPDALSRSLTSDAVLLADVRSGDATTLSGYAAADVEAIVVKGPGGPFEVSLGEPWTPDVDGAATVRPFAAVGGDGGSVTGDLRNYFIEARMEDGRTVGVRP